MTAPPFSVALIGRRLEDNENLGLGYLEAALGRAGVRVDRYELNEAVQVRSIGDALLGKRTDLVGLSLMDGGSALLPLVLGELLGRHGFAGHITAGGPFATLARDWLLSRYGWLDSVVRFAGEGPLCALVTALEHGIVPDRVPGVTTRRGDGKPAPVLDERSMCLVPVRRARPTLAGHGVAHLSATRGCAGRCAYCGPAALQSQELLEGKRSGFSLEQLRAAGVGGVRRRDLGDVCDEIATLWQDGVRYFYFVDEHLLPYREPQALQMLEALGAGLERRGVGALGFGCMLRAERLTVPIVQAFARVGLVRAYVGAEFASKAEGRQYARRVDPDHNLEVIAALSEAGVATVTNLMLVHPEATSLSLRAAMAYLERIPGGVFEATRTQVYHGTRLWKRMQSSGRLTGNPLRYGYTLADPAAQRFSEIFARLRGEAFRDHSLAYRTHDAFLTLALVRRLDSARIPEGAAHELEKVRCEVNALYTRSLSEALLLAEAGFGGHAATPFVRQVARSAERLTAKLLTWDARIGDYVGMARRPFSPLRAAAASTLSFALLGAACGGQAESSASAGGSTAVASGGAATSIGGTTASGGNGAAPLDAGSSTGGLLLAPTGTGGSDSCTDEALAELSAEIESKLSPEAARCAYAAITSYRVGTEGDYQLAADLRYWPDPWSGLFVEYCADPVVVPFQAEIDAALAAVPAPECNTYSGSAYLHGDAEAELSAIATAAEACTPVVRIVLDAAGQVADVIDRWGAADAETLECYRSALDGLSFPCLAGSEVCPEYVIIE